MTATITKIQSFKKTGKDLLGSGYGEVENNTAARSLGNGAYQVVLKYNFATDGAIAVSGGAVSLKDLNGNAFVLPTGAQVTKVLTKIDATFTSATDAATLALSILVDDVAGIKAALAISDASNYWDASGKVKACIQDGTAANASEITTAERAISIVNSNGSEATTAGALTLVVDYLDLA